MIFNLSAFGGDISDVEKSIYVIDVSATEEMSQGWNHFHLTHTSVFKLIIEIVVHCN